MVTKNDRSKLLLTLGGLADQAPMLDTDRRQPIERCIGEAYQAIAGDRGPSESRGQQLPRAFRGGGKQDLSEGAWRQVMSMFTLGLDPSRDDAAFGTAFQRLERVCRDLDIDPQTIVTGISEETMGMLLSLPTEAGRMPADQQSQIYERMPEMLKRLTSSLGTDASRVEDIKFKGDESVWPDASSQTRDDWARMAYLLSFPQRFMGELGQQADRMDRTQREQAIQAAHGEMRELFTTIGARGATSPAAAKQSSTGYRP